MFRNISKKSALFVAGALTVLSLGAVSVGAASALAVEQKADNTVQLAEHKRDVFVPLDNDCCNH